MRAPGVEAGSQAHLKKDAITFTDGLVIALALILIYLFVKSLIDWSDPANSYTGQSWLGWAPPAIIGVGFLVLGVVLLFAWRTHQREPFFKRRREVADPTILE